MGRDGPLWTSERDEDRAEAAEACTHCPVMALCRQAGEDLRATGSVWGGMDRSGTTAQTGREKTNRREDTA